MPQPIELATRHQELRTRLTRSASVKALRLWNQMDPQNLDVSWITVGPNLDALVTSAQMTAARQSAPYLNPLGGEPARIVPQAFAGVTLDGREVSSAMFGAVTKTKELTGRGFEVARAFEVGASFLATIVGAAIQDMGRQADSTLAVGKGWTRYVRVVNAGACSRCAVLAGKASYATPFLRHPRCKCTAFPLTDAENPAKGFYDSPDSHFESLSRSEQDRVYTRDGAEAIRKGADPSKVVNARRGAYGIGYSGHYNIPVSGNRLQPLTIGRRADGTPLQVYATTEGTTRRGSFGRNNFTGTGRRTTTIRLMPEQIAVMAGENPERWRELLIKYGYLV